MTKSRIRLEPDPGYPTLPGSASFGPSGPKERAFGRESRLFRPKAGFLRYPGSRDPAPAGSRYPGSVWVVYLWSSLIAFRPEEPAKAGESRLFRPEEAGFGRKKPAFWPYGPY